MFHRERRFKVGLEDTLEGENKVSQARVHLEEGIRTTRQRTPQGGKHDLKGKAFK